MPRPKLNRARINITLPADLLTKLDRRAQQISSTRSDLIEAAIRAILAAKR